MLRVAGCQFPVSGQLSANARWIRRQMAEAAAGGARLVQFCETALSGYAGVDRPDSAGIDWKKLRGLTTEICQAAQEHRVWVVLGSTHPLSPGHLPHNSLYIISDQGQVVDRYDKRFCTSGPGGECELDLAHYSPGNRTTVFEVDGIRCGVLICYDYRFPELYRQLKQQGVQLVCHSFHNARRDRQTHETGNVWKEIVPATLMCHAATNHVWISAVNSSARYSSWPNFFVQPHGLIAGRLKPHASSVLISTVDPAQEFWDAPGPWRPRAMQGQLHSGELVSDPRSDDRTCY